MAKYEVSHPQPDVVRVAFPKDWDAPAESAVMFRDVLQAIDDAEEDVTLLIVAHSERPVYVDDALRPARDVLIHESIKQIVIVADNASPAVNHMGARRGQYGLRPIPIYACQTEDEAKQYF